MRKGFWFHTLLQSQLAKLLGVDRISVQNWERGIYTIFTLELHHWVGRAVLCPPH
ncbi:MAG: helix-turn-helix domain-containing protein [Limisphaerales bacterium]